MQSQTDPAILLELNDSAQMKNIANNLQAMKLFCGSDNNYKFKIPDAYLSDLISEVILNNHDYTEPSAFNVPLLTNSGKLEYFDINVIPTEYQQKTTLLVTIKNSDKEYRNSLTDFLAQVSHELRTPLHGAINITNMLQESCDKDEQQHHLGMLNRSLSSLNTIINDLLDLNKSVTGKLSIVKKDFNLFDVLNTCIEPFINTAKAKNIALISNYNFPKNTCVNTDPIRFSQIFSNILTNSIKYTKIGSVNVDVKIANQAIYVEIKDTGIGIPKNMLQKVFTPFEQINQGEAGVGLGMSVAKMLSKQLEGTLCCESELGVGTTISLKIPFNKAQSGESVSIEPAFALDFSDKSCLVVEDDPVNLFIIKNILDKNQVNYDTCTDGKQSIIMSKSKLYDLILMDLNLPCVNGRVACKEIRTNSVNLLTPIIAVTADAIFNNINEFSQYGFNDCVAKPFAPQDILLVLKKYLG